MEWGSSILIILVFLGLSFYMATSVGIKNIKENWPQYRCNPLYMPFASTLAPVPTTSNENFSFCLQDFMKSAAPALTKPLSYVQTMTLALVGTMSKSQEKSVKQTSKTSFSINNLFKGLFAMVGGIIAQFRIMLIKLTDMQGKMLGAVTAVMYIVNATMYTFVSMWNGIPGALFQAIGKF